MSRRLPWVLAGLVLGAGAIALARGPGVSTASDGAVLHERLPPAEGARAGPPVFVYDPDRAETLPREVHAGGLVLPRPDPETTPSTDEAVYAPGGVATIEDGSDSGEPKAGTRPDERPDADPRGSLGTTAEPDRDTQKEGTLGYHTVFDPSVVPFKRNRALDVVKPDGSLGIGDPTPRSVEVAPHEVAPGHEVFWASLLVEARSGVPIPMPSVSPSSRVLAYETSPPLELRFFKDSADNMVLETTTTGRFRLVVLMDAPSTYFRRALPRDLTVEDVPSHLRPRPPRVWRERGRAVARELGLSSQMAYDALLDGLVAHFRSFEPGDPVEGTGDLYRDLALGRKGICRHRSYAFVVTAQALGIPARYVFNEAHVFVEVWVGGPRPGWLRVDLGGGADRLVVQGGAGKVRHDPGQADPFARPRRLGSDPAHGHEAGATEVLGLPPTASRTGRTGARRGAATSLAPRPLPPPAAWPEVEVGGRRTTTTLSLATALAYRGEPLSVWGHVRDSDGDAVRGGTVQIVLRAGVDRQVVGLLGVCRLGPEGHFKTDVQIPPQQTTGSYEIIAEFLGAPGIAPSRSH